MAAVLTQTTSNGTLGGSVSQILAGMNWLARGDSGLPGPVDIINASLGIASKDLYFLATVAANREAGVLLVAAVGNNGAKGFNSHTAPASFEGVIAVGAADHVGRVASFSAWGDTFSHPHGCTTHKPDFLAPGVAVASCMPKKKYGPMNGTSMAAPVASGAAALLIEKDSRLRRNPDGLATELLKHVRVASPQPAKTDPRRIGAGSLDLAKI